MIRGLLIMFAPLIVALAVVAIFPMTVGCSREPWTWRGIDGARATCSRHNGTELLCIVGERSYICVEDWQHHVNVCAPMPAAIAHDVEDQPPP